MQTQTPQQQPGYFNLELGAAYNLDAAVELELSRYRKKAAAVLAWIQTCIGAVCILMEVVYLMLVTSTTPYRQSNLSLFGTGIWTGVPYVITGVLGVLSARTAYKCRVVAFMLMSIICSTVAIIGIYFSIAAFEVTKYVIEYEHPEVKLLSCSCATRPEYLQVIILVAQIVEGITAVVSAAVCCGVACCCHCGKPAPAAVTYHPDMPFTTTAPAPPPVHA